MRSLLKLGKDRGLYKFLILYASTDLLVTVFLLESFLLFYDPSTIYGHVTIINPFGELFPFESGRVGYCWPVFFFLITISLMSHNIKQKLVLLFFNCIATMLLLNEIAHFFINLLQYSSNHLADFFLYCNNIGNRENLLWFFLRKLNILRLVLSVVLDFIFACLLVEYFEINQVKVTIHPAVENKKK